MSKFKIGDNVRITDPTSGYFDQVGRVAYVDSRDLEFPYNVRLDESGYRPPFREQDLTLADPDVHDVLAEMAEQSGLTQFEKNQKAIQDEKQTDLLGNARAEPEPVNEKPEPLADWELELLSGRRSVILRTAGNLITGQRAADYDTKDDAAGNFTRIGNLWSEVLGVPVRPDQVALCMAQVKIARLITSPTHQDSWIDLAGYAALGGEITERRA